MKQQIILIGGAPTTGKSTIARLLSDRLNIPWISTDAIRTMMQKVCNKNDYPTIFRNENYTAEKFLTEFSTEEIVRRGHEENNAVWEGARALIGDGYPWDSFIIEGIAIEPHLIAKDLSGDSRIKTVFLVDEDEDRIRDVVFNRGLWGSAETYSDEVKGREVDWVKLYSQDLKREAEKYNFSCVEVSKDKDDPEAVIVALDLSEN
jgi:2-phosphoglycerate kinase